MNTMGKRNGIRFVGLISFGFFLTFFLCNCEIYGGGYGGTGGMGSDAALTASDAGSSSPDVTSGHPDAFSPGTGTSSLCGNGQIDQGEQCEAGVWGGECNDLQACVDCQCSNLCGNDNVDPGEQCDPPGAACGEGYSCSPTCDCMQASCGDGVCDRPAGESETTCSTDCPATCGDGICNATAGEDTSCPDDCPNTAVDCCVQNAGCPSEGLYTCEGSDCCCCPYGARCVQATGVWVCGI